jgi:hypothetical protein
MGRGKREEGRGKREEGRGKREEALHPFNRGIFMRFSAARKIIYTLLVVLFSLTTGCTSLFFQPQKEHVDNPIAKLFLPEDVFSKTPDGLKLHGWFFKARDSRGSLLVLHGNAQNMSTHVNSVLWLVQEGFNVDRKSVV